MVSGKEINQKFKSKKSNENTFCPECGSKNPLNAEFCKECGTKIPKTEISKSTNTKGSKDGINGFFDKLKLWWNKRNKKEKLVTGVGVCCLGFIIIAIIGAALPQADRAVLVLDGFSGTYEDVKIDNTTTEYVITGHTEPNATVYVNNQPITLDADNKFSYKASIPQGVTEQKVSFKVVKTGKDNNYGEITIKRETSPNTQSSSNSQSAQPQQTTTPTPTVVTISELNSGSVAEGTLVKVTGTVSQSDGYSLRIRNSDYQDILIEGTGLSAYEDQTVTVTGTYTGPSTYTTITGAARTVPTIEDGKIV
ncbi:zinc ribbon domain-containing protein [Methanobacterium formicicum]|uniref:Zinc ribbon domain-containing protein n=1 Tax=Methanobacterium formicicum TaxID=2162 RepID=A0A843AKC6_METFO|nr:zinc ribbon domain-containing protein [Methanobacterium formicicum]MBF4474266.1 zinc ribbon domain-containing protein [Methanobacterium formicicum]